MKKIKSIVNALTPLQRITAVTIAILLVFMVASAVRRDVPLFTLGFFVTAAYVVYSLFKIRREKKRAHDVVSGPLSGMTLDFIYNIGSPVVIVEDGGSIIWHNKAAGEIVSVRPNAYGKRVSDVISERLTDDTVASLRSGNKLTITVKDGVYDVNAYKMGNLGAGHSILIFDNITELVNAKNELKDGNVVVAYVVIDNFAEAMQFVQDKYRTALAMIGGELDAWCKNLGGIMRESEKDKYLFIFEERHLESLVEAKFDILDRIRNIHIDGIDIPFTASLGLSQIKGTFAEKEKAASLALDLALQRGGDQAVVRSEKGNEIFGGRFKSVQKRTKIRSRIIADELMTLMKNGGNVLIQGHRFADHDSIASCIGMAKIARLAGKEPKVIVNIHDTNLKPVFAMMQDYPEYEDIFVDALEAQDLIRSDTINIVCDVNNPDQFEAKHIYENAFATVIIDHHRKIGEFSITPKISYIEPSASSASELICEMLEQVVEPGALSQVEADLLFSGLILDTKQFTKNTGVRTFGAAKYLRGEGAEPANAGSLLQSGLSEFKRQTDFESGAEYYGAGIIISKYSGECGVSDKIMLAKAADRLLGVAEIKATFTMCMIGEDTHISARSDGTVNVQLILEALGGGGHFDAAGAQLRGVALDEAYGLLAKAIDKVVDNK